MANLAGLLATAPSGLWAKIIFAFSGAVKNYALAIVLLTIVIKIVLLPFDFINRRSSAKMTEVQQKLAPEMEKIKRRYPDPSVQNQKMNELYRREGFNPMGSCWPMLVSMILSMVVFITLFGSLNSMAAFKITDQYEQLQSAYVQEYYEGLNDAQKAKNEDESIKTYAELTRAEIDGYIVEFTTSGDPALIVTAKENVKETYKNVKESFLWIKNVWIADSPTVKSIPTFKSYAQTAKLKFDTEAEQKTAEDAYNAVMGELEKSGGVNGYFILTILAALTTFLTQYLTTKQNQKKAMANTPKYRQGDPSKVPGASSGKTMMVVFPILMAVFTLSSNAVFALYIVAGQLFSTATAPLMNLVMKKMDEKKAQKPQK